MNREDREEAGATGAGPYAGERQKLIPMSTLESWTVSEGEPDVRGWEVRTLGGRPLGAVGDLLIDDSAGEVVFLDIDLSASDRRTFVPVRVVFIDRARRLVLMDSADLPDADSPRSDRSTSPGRRAADAGTVRYRHREREITRERPLADIMPASESAAGRAEGAPPERRRTERRRIERMSTGF